MEAKLVIKSLLRFDFLGIRSSSAKQAVFLMTIFGLVMLARSPALLLKPRLWAEEGTFYFANLQQGDLLEALSLQIRGNFQLLTNLITYLATFFPAEYAAHVTTYLSLGVSMILASMVGLISVQYKWPISLSILVIVTIALLPQGYEVYLSATNVQWVCSVTVLLVAVMNLQSFRRAGKMLIVAWVFICGLTGVPSVMLAPMFLMRKFISPSRTHFNLGLILSLCALVQLAIIVTSTHPDRYVLFDPFYLMAPVFLQSIVAPLIGVSATDSIAANIRDGLLPLLTFAILFCAASIGFFAFNSAQKATNRSIGPLILFLSWIGVSVLNVLGSIGDPIHLISGWGGGRYFFLGSCAFVLLLASAATPKIKSKSSFFALALLIIVTYNGVREVKFGGWKDWLISGKPWREEVLECHDFRPCDVTVWPGGEASTFKLFIE